MQLLEPVQPLHALVVHVLASLSKLQMNHANPITPMALRQGDDARP
jgi:hypothetical protein